MRVEISEMETNKIITNNQNLTVIYYTSNFLDEANPYFLANTRRQLLIAAHDLPIIVVSQKPIPKEVFLKGFLDDETMVDHYTNICVGEIGRGHLNIYKQILVGVKAANTPYVAMAEDDILYSFDHFHTYRPKHDRFAYGMSKWSLFTWTKPPLFSFRNRRMVVNSLIAKRDMLLAALTERFQKYPDESKIDLSKWGDPGRYEQILGVTVHEREEFWPITPNIVFSHE